MTTPYAPVFMPVCPPPKEGESLASWVDRVAAANDTTFGLTLAQMAFSPEGRRREVPAAWGIAFPSDVVAAVSTRTGYPTEAIAGTLLSHFDDGPLDLSGVKPAEPRTLVRAARDNWYYAIGSHYCPQCLDDDDGVWRLAWRLPWSFACTTHLLMLNATCPDCGGRAGAPRGQSHLNYHQFGHTPVPGTCQSASPSSHGHGTRGAQCDYPLKGAPALPLEAGSAELSAQARLDTLLADECTRQQWIDLRAVTSVLLTLADTGSLKSFRGGAPLLSTSSSAITELVAERDQQHQLRRSIIAGGGDGRFGQRQQLWRTTPTNPALMAAVVPASLRLVEDALTPDSADDVADGWKELAELARARHRVLPTLLRESQASEPLISHASNALNDTARFTHRMTSNSTSSSNVDGRHVPQLLWMAEWPTFQPHFKGTGTRDDTARFFTSMALVKVLTNHTWQECGTSLGAAPKPIPTLAANLVNRLNTQRTEVAFQDDIVSLAATLERQYPNLVDFAARRRKYRTLKTVPKIVISNAGLIVTEARRRSATAWSWAELTGSPVWSSPSWRRNGASGPTESEKEVYRRFVARDLGALEPSLRAWMASL